MSAAGATAAVTLFCLVSYLPGWALAAAVRARSGHVTRLFGGVVLTSVVGLGLAEAGWFSLASLLGAVAVVSIICAVLATRRRRSAAHAGAGGSLRVESADAWPAAAIAVVAAVATILWSWPPYETGLGASDSSMYIGAGAHLARTGSFAVRETVGAMLPHDLAAVLFASVGYGNAGPFIRLPGGLLMTTLETSVAVPAFFPLLAVWAAILALAGGTASMVLVAPLFSALAVFAIVLFAGEALGVVAAAIAAPLLVANFAVWWFAKFAMPEPLAAAAIWGGLVLLRRATAARDGGSAFLAGAIFGLAGLARTETFLYLLAAGALAWAWGGWRAPVASAVLGFVAIASATVLAGEGSPSHHLAYLRNDLTLHYLAILPWLTEARASGRLLTAGVLGLIVVLAAAVLGVRSGVGLVRGVLRLIAPIAAVAGLLVYARIANQIYPRRGVEWLATYCSWPLLALAVLGIPVVWRRDAALRLAGFAWLLATAVFVLNPRVAPYQPWAIRRALPLVIPGLVIAASGALAWLATRPRAGARLLAVACVVIVTALEVRWVLPARAIPYYSGNDALVRALSERMPADAIVAIEGELADVQLQVPLWLVAGRETLMLRGGGQQWQDVMRALVASGRPVFWIGSKLEKPSALGDIRLHAMEPALDLAIVVPDAPLDVPPSHKVTRLVSIQIYGVDVGVGEVRCRSCSGSKPLISA